MYVSVNIRLEYASTHGGLKRVSDLPEGELHIVVRHPCDCWENNLG